MNRRYMWLHLAISSLFFLAWLLLNVVKRFFLPLSVAVLGSLILAVVFFLASHVSLKIPPERRKLVSLFSAIMWTGITVVLSLLLLIGIFGLGFH
jgi:hypothetical protein